MARINRNKQEEIQVKSTIEQDKEDEEVYVNSLRIVDDEIVVQKDL